MKKLLSNYGFTNNSEYYTMIIESVVNGQRTQAKDQFLKLPIINRQEFVSILIENRSEYAKLETSDISMFIGQLSTFTHK